MTIATNTFTRFDQIGVREDLSDVIYNISPTQTPFMTNAGRGKADNTFFEWQTDSLADAVTTNQQIEGDELGANGYDAVTPTVRLGNYTEIARKTVIVSGTAQAVKTAGRANDLGYNVAKKGKEIKRDMEASLLANKGASAGSTAAARKTGALLAFLKTNVDKAANGTIPVYTNIPTDVYTDGTGRAFTETILQNMAALAWTSGAEPTTLMLGAANKQLFSAFSGVVELTSTQQARSQAKIIGAADAYVSDFGTFSVIANRFQRTSSAFLIDWDFVSVDYLRPFQTEVMAKTGDADRRMLLAEYGLRVKNEKAIAVGVDLTV